MSWPSLPFLLSDYLTCDTSTFLERLPYLYTIANAQTQTQTQGQTSSLRPPMQPASAMPPPPMQPQRFGAQQYQPHLQQQQGRFVAPGTMRPGTTMAALGRPLPGQPNSFGTSNAPGRPLPPPAPVLTPQLTPLQHAFIRNLGTYHPLSMLDQLTKQQAASFEQLQQQIRRAAQSAPPPPERALGNGPSGSLQPAHRARGPGPAAAHTLPLSELLDEIEAIED